MRARRLCASAIHAVLARRLMQRMIGVANRRLGFLHTVFLMYPANGEYTASFVAPAVAEEMRWNPRFLGVFWQNGRLGIVMGITAHEHDFESSENVARLEEVVRRVKGVSDAVGARQCSFAGILPGILAARRLVRTPIEVEVTVQAIMHAERFIQKQYARPRPLILLGGRGFIGRHLSKALSDREIHVVDTRADGPRSPSEWPSHLRGRPVLLINISRAGVLTQYADRLWPEIDVLNEVYPEPSQSELVTLRTAGCTIYHIAGVKAHGMPPFPLAYAGGIPCCAAWPSDKMEVIVRKL